MQVARERNPHNYLLARALVPNGLSEVHGQGPACLVSVRARRCLWRRRLARSRRADVLPGRGGFLTEAAMVSGGDGALRGGRWGDRQRGCRAWKRDDRHERLA